MAIDWEAYEQRAKKRDEYDYQKNIANNDLAPVRQSYFDDGYDFGDITKTILRSREAKEQETSSFDDALRKKYSLMTSEQLDKAYKDIESAEKKFKDANGGKFINYLAKAGSYIAEGKSGQSGVSIRDKSQSNIDKINDFTREKEIINIFKAERDTEALLGGLSAEQLQLLDNISTADTVEDIAPINNALVAAQGGNAQAFYDATANERNIGKSSRADLFAQLKEKHPEKSDDELNEDIKKMVELRKRQVNAEEQAKRDEEFKENASENAVASALLSRGANILGGMTGLTELYLQRDNEYGYDTNAAGFSLTNASNAIDEQVQLDHDWNIEVAGSEVDAFDFLYNAGTGIVDNLGRLALSGGNITTSSAMMFAQSTTQTIIDSKEKGYSDAKALTMGLLNGTFEAVSEKISLEIILGDGGNALKKIAKAFAAEGGEELTSNWLNRIADEIANGNHSELSKMYDSYISKGYTESQALTEVICSVIGEDFETFLIGGLSGAFMGGGNAAVQSVSGKKNITELTETEQKVFDKEVENRIAEEEKDGKKVTKKEESAIRKAVLNDMLKGYISIDTIESTLGGETYNNYKKNTEQEKSLQDEFDTLNKMKQGDMTGEQIDRRSELKQQLEEIKNNSKTNQIKEQLSNEVFELAKDSRLAESYNEKARRNQSFEADLSKYDAKQQEIVKKAIESGTLNNTNRAHEFVDMVAKISADKGVLFDFTNNEKIKNSSFAVEGKIVNGYVDNGTITLNTQSPKYLDTVVGHEITHVLEGTELYNTLQESVIEFAKSKGEYQNRYDALTEMYKDVEGANIDNELTADLVGEYLFTDTDFINNLSTKSPNVFKRIYNEIKYLCKIATAGSKEARELERVKRAFDKAYKESSKAKGDTKYSFVGVKSKSHSFSSFEQAARLEDVGKSSSEEIRQQTGWFRGYDGQWRYEISDRDMEIDTRGKFSSNPDVRRYTELVDKVYFDMTATETETQELKALEKSLEGVSVEPKTLSELIKHDKLFAAYPQLKDMPVYFDDIDSRGAYNPVFKEIVLQKSLKLDKNKLSQTLIHEIQHAIQDIEGFASGSNTEYWRDVGIPESKLREYYEKTAGEIEARDSAQRSWRTDEARKEKRPDIDRTDIIFADDSIVGNSIVEPFTDKNGNRYDNAVLLDTSEFNNVAPRNWWSVLKKHIENRVDKSTFIMPVIDENGHSQMLEFAKAKERVRKNGKNPHSVLGDLYRTKDNISKLSAIHIDEIVEVSEEGNPYYSLPSNHGWLDANGWLHRTANVVNVKNGNIYQITMDIAKAKDGRFILYALNGKTKKVGNADVNSLVVKATSGSEQNSNFEDILPRNPKKSSENTNYSLSDSEGNKLTEKQSEYFRNSKVRDADGNLLKVYHGTEAEFTVFDKTKGRSTMDIQGSFFSPWELDAKGYGQNVKAFYLNITNPASEGVAYKALNKFKGQNEAGIKAREYLESLGYDGVNNGDEEYIAFKPNQIKSVTNGNPTDNDDIRYSLAKQDDIAPVKNSLSVEESVPYAPAFYSQMGKVVDAVKQEKLGASSVIPMLKGKGVKNEEIKWSGIEEFLEGKKSVTKQELQEFIAGSMLQIEEEGLGTINLDELDKKFKEYTGDSLSDLYDDPYEFNSESFLETLLWSYAEYGFVNKEQYRELERLAKGAENGTTKWHDYKLDGGSNYRELLFKIPNSPYTNKMMKVHWGDDAKGILAHARVQDMVDLAGNKVLFIEEIQSDWHNEGNKRGYAKKLSPSESKKVAELLKVQETLVKQMQEKYQQGDFDGAMQLFEQEKKMHLEREKIAGAADGVSDAPFKENYHEYVLKSLIRTATEQGYDKISWTTGKMQEERWSSEFAEGYRIEYDQEIPKFLNKYCKKWGTKVKKLSENAPNSLLSIEITDSMKESVLYEGQPLYSLSEEGEQSTKHGNLHIKSEDVAYRPAEDIAPTVSKMEKVAPVDVAEETATIDDEADIEWEEYPITEVKTNRGVIPIREYRDIMAMQYGYDDYADMRKHGVRFGDQYDDDYVPLAPTRKKASEQDWQEYHEMFDTTEAEQTNVAQNDVAPVKEVKKQKTPDTAQPTAKILMEEPKTDKEKSQLWSKFKMNFIDKASPFETLALKTGNREVDAKFNSIRYSDSKAQMLIGEGAEGVKSLKDIKEDVEAEGLTESLYEYIYHKHNVDRMSLESEEGPNLERLSEELRKLELDNLEAKQLFAISKEPITGKTNPKRAELIETVRKYLESKGVKNKPVFGSSVTAEMSQQIVDKYESENPKLIKYANEIYNYNNHLRDLLVEGGVISQETADLWQKMYPHYVPVRRLGDEGLNVNVPLDSGRTGVNAPVKKATGGNRDILPLFDTMAQRTLQTYKAIAKNRFGIELKNTLGTTVESSNSNLDEVIDSIDTQEELLQKGKNGRNPTFTVFENGKKVTFEITDEMYDAMKPTSEGFAKTIKPLNKASNYMRGVLTEYNPTFMLTNAIKDAQDVLMNSQHAAKTYANFPKAVKELASKGKWFTEYMQNGGGDNTYFDKQTNAFDEEESGVLSKIIGMPLGKISEANNFIERIPRLAEYIASRESGRSVDVSMLDAARVTTNFAAGGDVTKFLNRNGATFLNASVQGAAQQVRNIREAKANGLKGWVQLATKVAIAGLPGMLLNGLLWDDDEEYEELSDYVKENYYIVAKTEEGKFVRIPKGRALAVIQEAFTQVQNALTGDDEVDLQSFLDLAVSNLAPNNPIDNNIIAPIAQVIENKTWYGEDLVPTRLQDLPDAEQYDESTDALSKWLGETLNVSPYKINYLLNQYSGGVGDVLLPMLTPEAESGEGSFLLAPLKDKFTTDSVLNNQNSTDFYNMSDELTKNANSKNATDEDILKNKYFSSVSADIGDLYTEKRKIQNSNLSDKEKFKQAREIQEQINKIAEEALRNVSETEDAIAAPFYGKGNIDLNNRPVVKNEDGTISTVRGMSINEDGKEILIPTVVNGKIVSDEEAIEHYHKTGEYLGKFDTVEEANAYANKLHLEQEKFYQNKGSGLKMSDGYATIGGLHYRTNDDGEWQKITGEQLEKQNKVTNGLGITPSEYWKNKSEYDFAYEKPEKYAVAKSVGGYNVYKKCSGELYDIKADKDENGKSISGSRKKKVLEYINGLAIDYGAKCILVKSEYSSIDYYNDDILEYLNGRRDISAEDKKTILKELGATVDSEGYVHWN